MSAPDPLATIRFIDNDTGESPVLRSGDQLIAIGTPQLFGNEQRQLCEVRRLMRVEEAEVAVYDAIEQLRGRVEVAGLGNGGEVPGTPKLRAQRLRQAASVVDACVNNLARAVELSHIDNVGRQ